MIKVYLVVIGQFDEVLPLKLFTIHFTEKIDLGEYYPFL